MVVHLLCSVSRLLSPDCIFKNQSVDFRRDIQWKRMPDAVFKNMDQLTERKSNSFLGKVALFSVGAVCGAAAGTLLASHAAAGGGAADVALVEKGVKCCKDHCDKMYPTASFQQICFFACTSPDKLKPRAVENKGDCFFPPLECSSVEGTVSLPDGWCTKNHDDTVQALGQGCIYDFDHCTTPTSPLSQ